MTTPDDATLDAALTQAMAGFTRDSAKEMADNGIFEASGKTAQQMKDMILKCIEEEQNNESNIA